MRLFEICITDGKLAQYCGDQIGPAEPVRVAFYRVSNIRESEIDRAWIGQIPWNPNGDFGMGVLTSSTGGHVTVDTSGWPIVSIKTPVPKPHDGLTYSWQWSSVSRSWVKAHFELCRECRRVHDVSLQHCGFCGIVIRNKARHFRDYAETCGNKDLNPQPGIVEVSERTSIST